VLMFFSEPGDDAPTVVIPSVLTTAAVTVSAVVTIVLGILPQTALDIAEQAAVFVR
jgi:NADH-quinone oxidoreductase subunit N